MADKGFGDRFDAAWRATELPQTQAGLGKEFGVSATQIQHYLDGKPPSIERAVLIAGKFGVCVEYLLTGRGPKKPGAINDPRLRAIIEAWPRITDDTKENILLIATRYGSEPSNPGYRDWEMRVGKAGSPQRGLLSPEDEDEKT